VGAKFYCPHAVADGNQCIQIREQTLEFSSTVSSTLSPYPQFPITKNQTKLQFIHSVNADTYISSRFTHKMAAKTS